MENYKTVNWMAVLDEIVKFNKGFIKAYRKMRSNGYKSACLLQRVVMPQKSPQLS